MDCFFFHFVSVAVQCRTSGRSVLPSIPGVTVPALLRAFWPSVSGRRCWSSCSCFWRRPRRRRPRRRKRNPPPATPAVGRTAARGTSCKVRAPPGESAGGAARGPRRCPAGAAPAPERRRAARCNDYPTGRDARMEREGGEHALTWVV